MPKKNKKPANAGKMQGTQFKPGQSGNPRGKAKGTRNKATLAAQTLLAGEAEALTRKAVELALEGDGIALRLCIERIYPRPKDAPIKTPLPQVDSAEDIPKAISAIFRMVSKGKLTPDEARTLTSIINDQGKAIELADIERRIKALEEKNEQESKM